MRGSVEMKKFSLLIVAVMSVISILGLGEAYAQSDAVLYKIAKKAAATGDNDYAFMCFRSIINSSSRSKFYKEALFSTGEYYYSMGDYRNADRSFSSFLDTYPKDEAFPFAIAYMLRIDEQMQISKTTEGLRKKLITFKQLSLLFSEFKELTYKSPLNLHYKAIYFIDRIEMYINEDLFEKIYF